MSWSFNPDSVESLNDRAFRDIKLGSHDYTITGCKLFERQGQLPKILFSLENSGLTYSIFLDVNHANPDTAKIAASTLKAFMNATGLSGNMVVERLRSFTNKRVNITAANGKKKDQPGPDGEEEYWIRIVTVDPASDAVKAAPPAPAPQAEYIAPAPEPVEAPPSDAAPVTAPAPAATPPGGAPPWKRNA